MFEPIIETCPSNPYQDEIYRACWLEHLASPSGYNEHHGDFSIHAKKVAKNLIPVRELHFFGGRTTLFQDFTVERVQAFADLTKRISWDSMYTVWAGSRQQLQAHDTLRELGYPILAGKTRPMHVADLRGGFEGYLANRKARDRYDIRRNLRQAHRCDLVTLDTFEAIDPFFDQFFEHHNAYWLRKTGRAFFQEKPERQDFSRAWAKAVYPTGRLRLQYLYIDGELANLSTAIMDKATFHWGLTINTGAKSELFPGLLGLYLRMQQAVDEGATLFNMQHGDFRYKLTARSHSVDRNMMVVINPRSLRGRLLGQYYKNLFKRPIVCRDENIHI